MIMLFVFQEKIVIRNKCCSEAGLITLLVWLMTWLWIQFLPQRQMHKPEQGHATSIQCSSHKSYQAQKPWMWTFCVQNGHFRSFVSGVPGTRYLCQQFCEPGTSYCCRPVWTVATCIDCSVPIITSNILICKLYCSALSSIASNCCYWSQFIWHSLPKAS